MRKNIFVLLLLTFLPRLTYGQYQDAVFKLQAEDNETITKQISLSANKDMELPLEIDGEIYGLSISGTTILYRDDSFVRVVLKDNYGYEYLVYECFPVLSNKDTISFVNTAIETASLGGVSSKNLKLELNNGKIEIDKIHFVKERSLRHNISLTSMDIQKKQNEFIVNKLNSNLKNRNMLWRAGVTSVSMKTFEEKKDMFGGKVPQMYGFEYYKGGIFVLPGSKNAIRPKQNNTDSLVGEWDWRNRHGKNWLTGVKDQGTCGSCWAFSAVSVLESYINLYYNRIVPNNDLSEQELVSCDTGNSGCGGGSANRAFKYIKNNGIVNESCFSYVGAGQNCNQKCQYPSERIFLENHDGVLNASEDTLKKMLFKSPISCGILEWNHIINFVGYKTVVAGDVVYNGNIANHDDTVYVSATNHASWIGRTAWLLKNSWDTDWGNGGYGYIVVDSANLNVPHYLSGRITSMNYDDSDIICSDDDGDGYYFWGIGQKPAHCPSWAPNTPDGDDSDINYGPLDEYGYLVPLPCGITIKSQTTYSTNSTLSCRLGIVSGGVLTISGTTTLSGFSKIRVCENGILIVDGGTINNADLELVPGCRVVIRNNGVINMAAGKTFDAPVGVMLEIDNGSIN